MEAIATGLSLVLFQPKGLCVTCGNADASLKKDPAMRLALGVATGTAALDQLACKRSTVLCVHYGKSHEALCSRFSGLAHGAPDNLLVGSAKPDTPELPAEAAKRFLPKGGLLILDGLSIEQLRAPPRFWLPELRAHIPSTIAILAVLPSGSKATGAEAGQVSARLELAMVNRVLHLSVTGREVDDCRFEYCSGDWIRQEPNTMVGDQARQITEFLRGSVERHNTTTEIARALGRRNDPAFI